MAAATRLRAGVAPIAIAVLVSLLPVALSAQIVAPAGRTLFNDGVMVRSILRYDRFEASPGAGDFERWRNVYALVWGARPHLSLSAVAPVVRTEVRTPNGAARSDTGLGDVALFARYDVLRRTVPGGYTRLAPEVGVKLATGDRPFGSGSTDWSAGLVYSHVRDPDWWIADLQLTLPGSGYDGLRSGERRRFDVAYLRRVLPRGGLGIPMGLLVLELNGESTAESRIAGLDVPGSGGDVLYLSPGFEYIAGRRVVFELSLPLAIYDDFEASRPAPEASLLIGARWLF